MRPMSTGIEESMFFAGTVSVMKTSLPERWTVILSIAAGMRMIGASGGPFLPHPAATTATRASASHEGHEDGLATKGTKTTKQKVFFFVTFVVRRAAGAT